MKNVKNARSILLTVVLFGTLALALVIKTFYPAVILPPMNIPNLVLLSLVALLLEECFAPSQNHCIVWDFLSATLSFGLLPPACGFSSPQSFWKLGLIGGAVFALTALAMDSVRDRLISGPRAKGALVATAFGIYLAAQCFTGILL